MKDELPNGWTWSSFSEIIEFLTDFQANGSFASLKENVTYYNNKNYAVLVRLKDLRSQLKKEEELIYTNKHGYEFLKKSSLFGGEILVANVGAGVGTTVIMPKIKDRATLAPNMFLVYLFDDISNEYFFHYSKSISYWRELKNVSSGSGQPKINKKQFKSINIPVPPKNEQDRIVCKLDELLTKLDVGIETLKQVQTLLKKYRQSVLKSAVEGKLTSNWRRQHKEGLEPADKLLERILKERKEKWESEQLTNFKAKRKKSPKDWQNKYKEPSPPDTSNLPELPEGWVWGSIDQIAYNVRYGSSSKTNMDSDGIPVLRMGNILEGKLIFDNLKYLLPDHNEFPDLFLQSGDLLFNRTNSKELVGKTSIFKGKPNPCSFASYLIRVRFCGKISSDFYSFFINSPYGRSWINSVVSQQVGQANVNGTKLKNLTVPLPSSQEQEAIVKEVERIFSIIDGTDNLVESELKRSNSLRQSILKKAFEGKLVPQDPNDEPASVLLERIKAEKSKLKN
jgi:type I restriction enzyme, S subunit